MTSRTKAIIGSAATVVVLAAVFFVGWGLSSTKEPPTVPTITLTPAQQSEGLYKQGLDALSSEETSTAVLFFKKALTVDPTNSAAQRALESATTKTTAAAATTTVAPKKPAPVDPFLKKVADIRKLLPDTLADYSLGSRESLGADASVAGSPNLNTSPATRVVWAVHDRGTAKAARAFLTNTTKELYGKDGASVTVAGYGGYFGTDGTRFASIAVPRGRYVFEVTLTSADGTTPAVLKALALQAAGAFPTAP
jgi:hypothetical protein